MCVSEDSYWKNTEDQVKFKCDSLKMKSSLTSLLVSVVGTVSVFFHCIAQTSKRLLNSIHWHHMHSCDQHCHSIYTPSNLNLNLIHPSLSENTHSLSPTHRTGHLSTPQMFKVLWKENAVRAFPLLWCGSGNSRASLNRNIKASPAGRCPPHQKQLLPL